MSSIGNKFKAVRIATCLTQKAFAEALHIKHPHVSQIENGKKVPSESLTSLMRRTFHVAVKWWNTGEGDILDAGETLDPLTQALMDVWRDASPVEKTEILHTAMKLREEKKSEEKK